LCYVCNAAADRATRFGMKPDSLVADSAFGSAESLAWLVTQKAIKPFIPVIRQIEPGGRKVLARRFRLRSRQRPLRMPRGYPCGDGLGDVLLKSRRAPLGLSRAFRRPFRSPGVHRQETARKPLSRGPIAFWLTSYLVAAMGRGGAARRRRHRTTPPLSPARRGFGGGGQSAGLE
jgi:hypothetical protein